MTIAVRDPDTRAWLRRAFQSLDYEVIPSASVGIPRVTQPRPPRRCSGHSSLTETP
jgi:hypothetical protein